MVVAVYPGTFDPFTLGHLDLIDRASGLFDKVIIAIAASTQKKPLFTVDERLTLGRELFQHSAKIEVQQFDGLLIDFARDHQATVLVRGIRTIGDFDFELQLARMNRHLMPSLETVFLMPSEKYIHISSTLVREISTLGGDVSTLVPASVLAALTKKREK